MTTKEIIKALRCFASLKEGIDPMVAIEDCPLTVLQEAADRLESFDTLIEGYPERLQPKATNRAEARHRTYKGFGEEHTNAQWARLLRLPRNTLWRYLTTGLTIEEIVIMRGIKYPKN